MWLWFVCVLGVVVVVFRLGVCCVGLYWFYWLFVVVLFSLGCVVLWCYVGYLCVSWLVVSVVWWC